MATPVSFPRRRSAVGLVAILAVVASTAVSSPALAGPSPAPAGPEPAATTTVTGVVQDVVLEDRGTGHGPEVSHKVLRVGDDVISLAAGSLPGSDSGETVRVTLAPAVGGEQEVLSAQTVESAPADDPDAGVHNVYVALVRPAGTATSATLYTAAEVTEAVRLASEYWSSQTNGQIRFRVAQTLSPYTSSFSCTGGVSAMWQQAAALLNIPASASNHLLVVAPRNADTTLGCPYGSGSVGTSPDQTGLAFVSAINQSLVAHELGHNLGLHHSNALHCDAADPGYTTTQVGAVVWPSACTRQEYGDLLDVMGFSGQGYGEASLNAVHLDRMGLLPAAVRTVAPGVTENVRITPLSTTSVGRVVKIVDGWGNAYYVEYRTATGRDAVASGHPMSPSLGVRVLRQNPEQRQYSGAFVLDGTPGAAVSGTVAPNYTNNLPVGQSFTSAGGLVTVTVGATDAGGADLTIVHRSAVGAPAAPASVVLTAPVASVVAGTTTAATVAVANAAGGPVPGWGVQVQFAPTGSSTWRDVRTVRTGPSGSAAVSLPATVSGSYRAVTQGETDVASVASATTSTTVGPPVTVPPTVNHVTLTGLPASAPVGAALRATATVTTAATAPVPGRAVQLQRRANGTTAYETVGTATTASNGVASINFTNGTSGSYRLVTVAVPGTPAVVSAARSIVSQGMVTLQRPATSTVRGRYVATSGTIRSVPAPVVYLQTRYGSGAWSTPVRATVRGTAVSGSVRLASQGTYQVRYYLAPGAGSAYAGAYSTAYSVRVN